MTIDCRTNGNGPAGSERYCEAHKKRPRLANVAPKKGKSGRRPSPRRKRQKREESQGRPGRQQDGEGTRFAQTCGRRYGKGSDESHRLATTLRSRVPVDKKMGLTFVSTKGEDGERSYPIKAVERGS